MSARRFEDLLAWQKAHRCVVEVYRVSGSFPREEMFGLTSQIRRAAISVPANIAEGFNRRSLSDKLRFYNIAQASLEECRYHLLLAEELGYADTAELRAELDLAGRLLESYCSKIRRSRSQRFTQDLPPP